MNIRLKIIVTLALIIPVMVVFLILFQIVEKKNETLQNGIEESYQVINQINTLLSDMQNAETGKRGFIITNDKSFLEPYAWSVKKVDADLTQLRTLTQANTRQQQYLNEFEPIMRNALVYMAETITLRDEHGIKAAAKRVSSKTGKVLMDRMRTLLGNMINEEQRLVMARKTAYKQTLSTLYNSETVFVAVMTALSCFIGFVLIRSITWVQGNWVRASMQPAYNLLTKTNSTN